ncbi:MAG: sigma-70 family RNA polymerase sigma factor [Acidobacteriia bacterium]|nr:sigma-70 family RNA polymerase sigma factor [Terriglobia bacterium]
MRRSRRSQISKEIASIASLKESAIDLSDVPELKDWSHAVVGRFHRPYATRARHIESHADAGNQQAKGAEDHRFREMDTDFLVGECIRGVDDAWAEFLRRSRPLAVEAITQTLRRYQHAPIDLLDELVQEVYIKLMVNECRGLKALQSCKDTAFAGLVKTIAANVVQESLRANLAAKRGAFGSPVHLDSANSDNRRNSLEQQLLLGEIDRILRRIASQQDASIFWLYYHQGLTAREIASQQKGLTTKGVESVLLRLQRAIKQALILAKEDQRQIGGGPARSEHITPDRSAPLLQRLLRDISQEP